MSTEPEQLPEGPKVPPHSPDLDKAFAALRVDPNDPLSVRTAIHEMSVAIDAKLSPYGLNSHVQDMGNTLKETYRQALLNRSGISG